MMALAYLFLDFFAGHVALNMVEGMGTVGLQLILASLCPEVVSVVADEDAAVA